MISYYKFTNGSAFTLSGYDYSGYFNVEDGRAYTERTRSSTSIELSAKRNFLAYCFLGKREFDNAVGTTTTNYVSGLDYSPRNLLSNDFLRTNFKILFENNLSLYSLSQLNNPAFFDANNTVLSSTGFFGLSSTTIDERTGIPTGDLSKPNDVVMIKETDIPYQIDPFLGADKNVFPDIFELDNANQSFVETYGDGFIYTISTDTRSIAFSADFGGLNPGQFRVGNLKALSLLDFNDRNVFKYIVEDKANGVSYSLDIQGAVPFVDIIDAKIYRACQTIKLVDRIKISENRVVNNNVGYGNKFKAALVSNESGDLFIEISRKEESEVLRTIAISSLGNPEYVKIALRSVDDLLVIITKPMGIISEFKLYQIDLEDYFLTDKIDNPKTITRINYNNQFAYNMPKDTSSSFTVLGTNNNNHGYYYPMFLREDEAKEMNKGSEAAKLTFPEYPGVDFYFSSDYLFFESGGAPPIGYQIYRGEKKMFSLDISFAQYDSNLIILNDNDNISERFLTNPTTPVSVLPRETLVFPEDLLFDTTNYKFDSVHIEHPGGCDNFNNQWKFNTNLLESNRLSLKNVHVDTFEDELILYYQNIGRLYYNRQKVSGKTLSLVSKDLRCFYTEDLFDDICNTGIGININTLIQDILRDTINLNNSYTQIPTGKVFFNTEILNDFKIPPAINVNVRDYYFHSNESVNYLSVNRVFSKLFELQKAIYDSILGS